MTTFADMGLSPVILEALRELGFDSPTPIQRKVIPHLLNSRQDLVALAQTGTGKTAAFSLPIVHQIDMKSSAVQAVILCPTRELCMQIAGDIAKFVKYIGGMKVVSVYGGDSIERQIRALKANPQIVVGTPGRMNDLIRRRCLKVEGIEWLVLDEADEMLNMGFKDDLDAILADMPEGKQTLLFSATMPKSMASIVRNYMNKPEEITAGDRNASADNVDHFYYVAHARDRYAALRRIADANPEIYGIVFCRTRRETAEVADKLIQDNYSAEAIHGDLSQAQRSDVMNRFRKRQVRLLVATDVAARGIDVSDLTHVINYNLPENIEAYVHRSGRTGRAQKSGVSIVIVNMRELHVIRMIERKIEKKFERRKIPNGGEICEKQLFTLIDKVQNVEINEAQIGQYLPAISKKLEGMEREDLIKHFVSMEFNRFLSFYKDAPDLNVGVDRGNGSDRRSGSGAFGGRDGRRDDRRGARDEDSRDFTFAKFKIGIGRRDGLDVKKLLTLFNSFAGLRSVEIGKIEVEQTATFFEVDQNFKEEVVKCFRAMEDGDRKVNLTCIQTGIKSGGASHFGRPKKFDGGGRKRGFQGRPGNSGGRRGKNY